MTENERKKAQKNLYRWARGRAKKKNREFSLSLSDIRVPNYCPVLGIKLIAGSGGDDAPTIDRIDNSKGYTKDNIIVVSMLANSIKCNATPDQIIKVGKFYKSLQGWEDKEQKTKTALLFLASKIFPKENISELNSILSAGQ